MLSAKPLLAALALLGVFATPAAATPISYTLASTLIAVEDVTQVTTLRGTFSYDGGEGTQDGAFDFNAQGTFEIAGSSALYTGWASLMRYDGNDVGVYFSGTTEDGAELSVNVLADFGDAAAALSSDDGAVGTVTTCITQGCSFFDSVKTTLSVAVPYAVERDLISPVPLPAGFPLFCVSIIALGAWGLRRALPQIPRAGRTARTIR